MKKNLILNCVWALLFVALCSFKYPESRLAHQYLDGLSGLEIGASAVNPYGLKTLNVDYSGKITPYKKAEIEKCGTYAYVNVVSAPDHLPFEDSSYDFVLCSHLEQIYDPIKSIKEWMRVVKPGGYVYIVAQHLERSSNSNMPRTTLKELFKRNDDENPPFEVHKTFSFWKTEDVVELCTYFEWTIVHTAEVDDKVGDSFVIILKK